MTEEQINKRMAELSGWDKIECPKTCNSDPDKICNDACVSGDFWKDFEITLEILVKAMWKQNEMYRNKKSIYSIEDNTIIKHSCFSVWKRYTFLDSFELSKYNNDEQTALYNAIKYAIEQEES